MVNINMYAPPIELQERYAQFIELLNRELDILKENIKDHDNLFQSLMQKAFKGELDLKGIAA